MFYQLKSALAYRLFGLMARGLDETPALSSASTSPCEVHTMLGTRDVTMYLLAVKSLLSHVDVTVVIHSDGSLSSADVARISRHVRGVTFVDHEAANERAQSQLQARPLLAKWRNVDISYRRMIDIELWRRAERIVILDSDVLVNNRPSELIDWIRGGVTPFVLGQPPSKVEHLESAASPSDHIQTSFLRKVPELSTRLGLPQRFLQGATAGFCGYTTELSLERIERLLTAALDLGLRMDQWGGEQCIVIYLLSTANAERLPAESYVNFDPSVAGRAYEANIIHFYGTHRFYRLLYPRLAARAVRSMKRSHS